ncbi:MAG: hypothetical protein ACREOH_06210 [Candidatus Entotheonellia bacterium]
MARRGLTGVLVLRPELSHSNSGVSDKVLEAMVATAAPAGPPLATSPPAPDAGASGHDRITDRQPLFSSSYSASELQLVRLKPARRQQGV